MAFLIRPCDFRASTMVFVPCLEMDYPMNSVQLSRHGILEKHTDFASPKIPSNGTSLLYKMVLILCISFELIEDERSKVLALVPRDTKFERFQLEVCDGNVVCDQIARHITSIVRDSPALLRIDKRRAGLGSKEIMSTLSKGRGVSVDEAR